MMDIKRLLPLGLFGAALVFALAVAVAFWLTFQARREAARYLRLVTVLRISTTYDAAISQLGNAGLSMRTVAGDCHHDCTLNFEVGDEWLYKLHLAPPVGFNGWLEFRNGTLTSKSTSMGQDVMVWSATVSEGSPSFGSLVAGLHGTQDSSGNLRHLFINLLPADFSEYRTKAYAFNVACIGSMKACKADEFLPIAALKLAAPQVVVPAREP